jgi:hypothetical protein
MGGTEGARVARTRGIDALCALPCCARSRRRPGAVVPRTLAPTPGGAPWAQERPCRTGVSIVYDDDPQVVSLFLPCTKSIRLAHDVFDGMAKHPIEPLGEHTTPYLAILLAIPMCWPTSRGKNRALPMVMCLLWLNCTAATARPPTLVCRPSSRALRLQVPLSMIRARAPLDLSVLSAVERTALLVLPPRLNRRLVHVCMHA